MLTVYRNDGRVILIGEAAYQFTGHHEGFFVGQTNLFMCLDGSYGGLKSGKAHHGSEHHVDGSGLYDLAKRLSTGINLDVGLVAKRI